MSLNADPQLINDFKKNFEYHHRISLSSIVHIQAVLSVWRIPTLLFYYA